MPRMLSSTLMEISVVDYSEDVMGGTEAILTSLRLTPEETWAFADQHRATRKAPGTPMPTALSLGGVLWTGESAADQA